jgi:hypothetical protein
MKRYMLLWLWGPLQGFFTEQDRLPWTRYPVDFEGCNEAFGGYRVLYEVKPR